VLCRTSSLRLQLSLNLNTLARDCDVLFAVGDSCNQGELVVVVRPRDYSQCVFDFVEVCLVSENVNSHLKLVFILFFLRFGRCCLGWDKDTS
jgi:hypothetical protein